VKARSKSTAVVQPAPATRYIVEQLLAAAKSALELMREGNISSFDAEACRRFTAVKWQLEVAINSAEGENAGGKND
jgi:hypothetical protein